MANQQIFCNTPWYEIQIYWDGSFGICCQESHRLYSQNEKQYNIRTMSIREWFNSAPARNFRVKVLGDSAYSACSRCYTEEEYSVTSRRVRANQKSAIFTKQAFAESYQQSPGKPQFDYSEQNAGRTNTVPVDIHVDLGNYCNLACKMCNSAASSKIATQYFKWGLLSSDIALAQDWTKDNTTWKRFLTELLEIPNLRNIHLMGGETLLTSKFQELVEWLDMHNKHSVGFSFVTNGTQFNPELLKTLSKFARVGIEVSIETVTPHNQYVRQGTDLDLVLTNIDRFMEYSGDNIDVTIRPAIGALTIGYYHTLLEYCLDKQLLVKSLVVSEPGYLNVSVLPAAVRTEYKSSYQRLLEQLDAVNIDSDFNESDRNNYQQSIKQQVCQALSMLSKNYPDNPKNQQQLVEWCSKWDKVYGYNAKELYPELIEIFNNYGY